MRKWIEVRVWGEGGLEKYEKQKKKFNEIKARVNGSSGGSGRDLILHPGRDGSFYEPVATT